MNRRGFIGALAGAVIGAQLAAEANLSAAAAAIADNPGIQAASMTIEEFAVFWGDCLDRTIMA